MIKPATIGAFSVKEPRKLQVDAGLQGLHAIAAILEDVASSLKPGDNIADYRLRVTHDKSSTKKLQESFSRALQVIGLLMRDHELSPNVV